MNKRQGIVACLIIVIVILGVFLGGFAYAYINKLNGLNQTKSYFQSLGFDIINDTNNTPAYFIRALQYVANVTSFISIARQNGITTIFEAYDQQSGAYYFSIDSGPGSTMYVYKYTPSNSIWWIWA